MKILVVIIPGLGNGGLDPNDPGTWPSWVPYLINTILSRSPDTEIMVGNYTDPQLPEKVIAKKQETGCDAVVSVGHSDGGCCSDWMQDHVRRLHLFLAFALMVFLDNVTDLIRHGFLSDLDPDIVLRAVRIYQTADLLIHSNPVKFRGGVRTVEELWIGGPPFNHPQDNHEDVAEDPSVHAWIADQVEALALPSSASVD